MSIPCKMKLNLNNKKIIIKVAKKYNELSHRDILDIEKGREDIANKKFLTLDELEGIYNED